MLDAGFGPGKLTDMFQSLKSIVSSLRRTATLAAVAGSTLIAGAAWADPPGRVGRVAETQGTVWMQDDSRGEWIAASRNRPLTSGDRLSLQQGSRAVVQIGSGTLRLDGDTELEVLSIDDRMVRLHVHEGSVAMQLPVTEFAREFEISTAEGRVMPLQRSHFRVDRRQQTTMVTAWDGPLRFESRDSALDIAHGQRAEFWVDGGRTNYQQSAMGRDAFTDWVVASEREYGALAQQRYVSPEMTGATDLQRYGDWDTHPQYGPVWFPRRVASGWAPYRYGQWTWVSPWGWTWVDDEPWGFAPSHYGRWVHWNGRWCWTPGTYVSRPIYAPALVAWFGGPHLSVRVSTGPHIGWVPLAPFEVYRPWFTVSSVWVTAVNVRPWREVRGYHTHRHDDYTHRGAHGVTLVPQHVVTDRRPVRADVITPYQASVWRGGNGGGGAPAAPGRVDDRAPSRGGDDRVAAVPAFVPPAPAMPSRAVVPAQAPGSSRAVPWIRNTAAVQGAPAAASPQPGVISTPAVTTRDGVLVQRPPVSAEQRVDARDDRIERRDDRRDGFGVGAGAGAVRGMPAQQAAQPTPAPNASLPPPVSPQVAPQVVPSRAPNGYPVQASPNPVPAQPPAAAVIEQRPQRQPMPMPEVRAREERVAPTIVPTRPMPQELPQPQVRQQPQPQPQPQMVPQRPQVMQERVFQPPMVQQQRPQNAQPSQPQRPRQDDDDRGPRRGQDQRLK